jgi:plastocyanin
MKNHYWSLGIILPCALFLAGCASSPNGSTPTAASSVSVSSTATQAPVRAEMRGNTFIPRTLKVKVGTTVTWWNMDLVAHSVHADDASFKSNMIPSGQTFSVTFAKAGLFRYYSDGEGGPNGKGMSGEVEVTP